MLFKCLIGLVVAVNAEIDATALLQSRSQKAMAQETGSHTSALLDAAVKRKGRRCKIPSTVGYDFAKAGGIRKMTEFGPTGLACASGYSGSVMASVCSSPGAAYSVTGCEPTCAVHPCTGSQIKKLLVDSLTNPTDSLCCEQGPGTAPACPPKGTHGHDSRRRRHSLVENVTVACGPCVVTSRLCVTSPGWPERYGNNQRCKIHMPQGPIDVKDFDTEASGYDELEVNGVDHQGSRAYSLNGVIADGPIEWTSDYSVTRTGWKICVTPSATPAPTTEAPIAAVPTTP